MFRFGVVWGQMLIDPGIRLKAVMIYNPRAVFARCFDVHVVININADSVSNIDQIKPI